MFCRDAIYRVFASPRVSMGGTGMNHKNKTDEAQVLPIYLIAANLTPR